MKTLIQGARLLNPADGTDQQADIAIAAHRNDAAVAGGVTSLVCPPDTEPVLDESGLVKCCVSVQHGCARRGCSRSGP